MKTNEKKLKKGEEKGKRGLCKIVTGFKLVKEASRSKREAKGVT